MFERQSTVSRRQFLTTMGAFAAGAVALAACGTTATPTVAPAATTAPAASVAPATTAPTATASSAPAAAASIAPATAPTAPTAAAPTATTASTAAATTAATRTTAAAASSGEGDVPNGNFGGSKFYSAVVDQKVDISSVAGALKWDKAQYTAKAGDVTFVVKNLGPAPHQLGVESGDTKYESGTLAPNSTTNLTIKGLKAGEYDIVCNIPGHKAAGMVAKLLVS